MAEQPPLNLSPFVRRYLTVLECDLVGSTTLACRLEPEDFKDLLIAYQHCVRDCIEALGGYVAQYAGDAVWAYFGYPYAHKDDVQRAISASIDTINIIDSFKYPDPLQIRIGIATGLCVVGELYETPDIKRVAAFGDSPHLAARLQSITKPGTIAVSDMTRSLAGVLFEFEDLQWHHLKGFPRPLRVWKVIA